jgi:hypothetical protein
MAEKALEMEEAADSGVVQHFQRLHPHLKTTPVPRMEIAYTDVKLALLFLQVPSDKSVGQSQQKQFDYTEYHE